MSSSDEPIRPITSPSEKIVNAIAELIHGFQYLDAVQDGRITLATLKTEIRLIDDETGKSMGGVSRTYTTQQFVDSAWNALWAQMAIGAIAIDEALDSAFHDKTETTHLGQNDMDAARSIIYQVRNAFAHEPFQPTWRCTPKYHRLFRVSAANVEWNGRAVHGHGFAPADVGGWLGYFRLLDYIKHAVQPSS
jgi:hypothetical protein